MNFNQAFEVLLGHEGKYSNNPADPGGETMYGITKAVAATNGYHDDMRNLPIEFAKKVYRRMYWDQCRCDDLPADVRFDVFDAAVNSGVAQATKWLQRAVGVTADGIAGRVTVAASQDTRNLVNKFNGQRLMFMTDLPTWSTFGKGWARRIASNLMRNT